jgi:hypothetical protein
MTSCEKCRDLDSRLTFYSSYNPHVNVRLTAHFWLVPPPFGPLHSFPGGYPASRSDA